MRGGTRRGGVEAPYPTYPSVARPAHRGMTVDSPQGFEKKKTTKHVERSQLTTQICQSQTATTQRKNVDSHPVIWKFLRNGRLRTVQYKPLIHHRDAYFQPTVLAHWMLRHTFRGFWFKKTDNQHSVLVGLAGRRLCREKHLRHMHGNCVLVNYQTQIILLISTS